MARPVVVSIAQAELCAGEVRHLGRASALVRGDTEPATEARAGLWRRDQHTGEHAIRTILRVQRGGFGRDGRQVPVRVPVHAQLGTLALPQARQPVGSIVLGSRRPAGRGLPGALPTVRRAADNDACAAWDSHLGLRRTTCATSRVALTSGTNRSSVKWADTLRSGLVSR